MYDLVEKEVLKIPRTTPTGQKRRSDQTVWSTIVREKWSAGKRTVRDGEDTDQE